MGLFGLFRPRFETIGPIFGQFWAFLAYVRAVLELLGLFFVNFGPFWPILGHFLDIGPIFGLFWAYLESILSLFGQSWDLQPGLEPHRPNLGLLRQFSGVLVWN